MCSDSRSESPLAEQILDFTDARCNPSLNQQPRTPQISSIRTLFASPSCTACEYARTRPARSPAAYRRNTASPQKKHICGGLLPVPHRGIGRPASASAPVVAAAHRPDFLNNIHKTVMPRIPVFFRRASGQESASSSDSTRRTVAIKRDFFSTISPVSPGKPSETNRSYVPYSLHPNMYLSYHIISEKSAFFQKCFYSSPLFWYNKISIP